MAIRLMENFRALFYAPYYAAISRGFFARAGVAVELLTSDAPGDAVPLLLDGRIDLTWGGPMRVMIAHDRDPTSPLTCFGEMVARDPFLLIARHELGDVKLADLPRLRFASVSEVPTPWQCLQHDLREAGVDPETMPRATGRTMTENFTALRDGTLDVMQAFEPFGVAAKDEGFGRVVWRGTSRGPCVYTAFIATRESVARHRDGFAAIVTALRATQDWWHAAPADECAAAAQSFFPDVAPAVFAQAIENYRAGGLWSRTPDMARDGFERLGASFVSGGMLSRPPRYERCVADFAGAETAA